MVNQIEANIDSAADWVYEGAGHIKKCVDIANQRVRPFLAVRFVRNIIISSHMHTHTHHNNYMHIQPKICCCCW